jgi:hypothetical protein
MAKKRTILNTSYSLDNSTKNDDGETISYMDSIASDELTSNSKIGNPLDLIQKDYEEFLIEKISENLSEMEKKVFVLRFIKGYSYKEVAKELNLYKKRRKNGRKVLDQKSVDNAIWRSRPKIKKVLEKLNLSTNCLNMNFCERGNKNNGKNSKIQTEIKVSRRRNIPSEKSYKNNIDPGNDSRNR